MSTAWGTNHLAADSVSTPTKNITKCKISRIVILITQAQGEGGGQD